MATPVRLDQYHARVKGRLSVRTLCFPLRPGQVLLGRKKRGFGAGRFLGFGGKVEAGETVAAAARRELEEEAGIAPQGMERVATLVFLFPYADEPAQWSQEVAVFTAAEWRGEVEASDEMEPEWFAVDAIPFAQMWPDAVHWLPLVLEGKRLVGRFIFNREIEIYEQAIEEGTPFH